nr:hypothetical protein [Saprospira grandis]
MWGLSCGLRPCCATLWGSQVCSALRAPLRSALGLAFGHPAASLGRPALGHISNALSVKEALAHFNLYDLCQN